MINKGSLEAILLTGLRSINFINLIQNYLDCTGDVQTAAIVGLHACQLDMDESNMGEQILIGKNREKDSNSKRSSVLVHSNSSKKDLPLIIKLGGTRLAIWVNS